MIQGPSVDWVAIAPEVALIIGAFGLLLLATFARAHERGLSVVVGLGTLAVSAAFSIAAWGGAPVLTMANAFRIDDLTELVRITVAVMAAFVILLSVGWARFREHGSEFTALLLLVCAGMGIVAGSTSFVTLFVGLELFSLSLYVLCAFDGKSRASLEAGFKYLVLGTIGSIVLVYGAAFLYGATGSFMYGGIADALAKGGSDDSIVTLGTALVLIGLLFKVGAMPFHMWVPDVYEGAPTQVTGFMAGATKLVAFVALARVVLDALPSQEHLWSPVLIIAAVVTIIGGNIAALVQTNVKRMIAWSSVGAAGYALIGIIVNGSDGLRGLVFYLAAYAFTAMGAFAVIAVFERDQTREKGYATLDGMRAWGYSRPFAGMAMVVFLLAFAGFPPTAGFIGKFVVSGTAVSNGYAYLAIVGAIGSVIGLGYYLRVVLAMYDRSRKSDVGLPASPGLGGATVVILLCLAVVLLGGILPGIFLDWSGQASAFLAVVK